MKSKVAHIMEVNPSLTMVGMDFQQKYQFEESRSDLLCDSSLKDIERAYCWVKNNLTATPYINREVNSQGICGYAEYEIGRITNGQMIVALLLAGYSMLPSVNSTSAAFNVSKRSIRAYSERLFNERYGVVQHA